MKYTIGSDVEFFLADYFTNRVVSAERYIKGTKAEPYKIFRDDSNPEYSYFATLLDNVLAEGNIPPASSADEFCQYISVLREFIDSETPDTIYTLAIPAARLDDSELQTENARTYGCDPSMDCWTEEVVYPELNDDNLRAAGFHIHIGYSRPSRATNLELAKAMDLFLGVPSVIIEPENERKRVGYGLAGNYRDQPHGMEYRSLSSFFASDNKLISWCFDNTNAAIKFVNDNLVKMINGDEVRNAINNEDKDAALTLINEFKIPVGVMA